MALEQQNYSSHRRYYPWHHFVVQPILLANMVLAITQLTRTATLYNLWLVIFATGLVIFSFTARSMALRAQDRVIRLEETLRLTRLLPNEELSAIDKLKPRHLVALRFASDAEVPDLVRRCVAGEFESSDDVKKAIRVWRPDYLRV